MEKDRGGNNIFDIFFIPKEYEKHIWHMHIEEYYCLVPLSIEYMSFLCWVLTREHDMRDERKKFGNQHKMKINSLAKSQGFVEIAW